MKGRVFQRTPGRGKPWSYAVDIPRDGDGRRRQRLKGGFRTRADAERGFPAQQAMHIPYVQPRDIDFVCFNVFLHRQADSAGLSAFLGETRPAGSNR